MVKCHKCGITSELAEAFIQRRKAFRSTREAWCPACWKQKIAKAAFWTYFFYPALALLGFGVQLAFPSEWIGPFLMQICLLYCFMLLTIVPHELGHAWTARLVGWRVFRIVIGIGKSLGKTSLLGFEVEWKTLLVGGITHVAPGHTRWFRTKLFLLVLAGLLVNVVMGLLMLVFFPWQKYGHFDLDLMPMVPKLFLAANAVVILINLWPRTHLSLGTKVPSDGKQLVQAPFYKAGVVADRHADAFTMEAMESLSQHRDETAREWIRKGLALYPNNLGLLNVSGILAIRENDFALAREIFCRLLERKETKGLHRYLIFNNIAYVDALMGTPELLDEAEKYSLEALRGIAWLPNMVGTRGTVLVERGDLEQGIPLLEKAMNDSEDIASKAENACILAIAESRRAKADRARSFLNLAEKLNPQCHLLPRVRQTLGR